MKLVLEFMVMTLVATSYAASDELQELDNAVLYQHVYPAPAIVGGEKAAPNTHKYMVGLSAGVIFRGLFCGGSLISQRTVLTAAHCIRGSYENGRLIRSLRGTVGTLRWNKGGHMYSFERNVTYPHYVRATITNDLGLLITTTTVELSHTVALIAINFNFQGADVPVSAAGWGAMGAGKYESDDLLVVNSTVIEGNRCVREAKNASIVLKMDVPDVEPEIQICAFHKTGFGMCNGDSGSPLVRIEDDQQVGIVSWGFPCALGAPDVFVRVSAFKEWIQQNMAGKYESDDLLVVNSTVIEGNRCVREAKNASIVLKMDVPDVEPEIQICAFHKTGFGMCNGDSGSPLVRIEDDQQVGIVSWGFPCALGAPDVFVRVSAFKEWIQQNMV